VDGRAKGYSGLLVYRKACELAEEVFHITLSYPKVESYGLASQRRRAAFSIPLNNAEGYGRGTRREYVRFLMIANGSCNELESQLTISHSIGLIQEIDYSRVRSKHKFVALLLSRLLSSLAP
jgi:four helix bundle protein